MNPEAIISLMPEYRGREVLINDSQDTGDIIKAILDKHDRSKEYYDRICLNFHTGDPVTTAKYLFNFLKANVNYKVEGTKKQTVKSPQALLIQGKGDCKHYASFINGVFDALKRKGIDYDTCYRFVSYGYDKRPKHVFAVLTVGGEEYFIDPVLNSFDKRRPMYNYKEDYTTTGKKKKEQIGALYDISGIQPMHWTDEVYGNGQVGFLKGVRKFVKKNVIDAMKTNVANAGKGVQKHVIDAMKTNAANAGKGVQKHVIDAMKTNAANAGKGVQKHVIDAMKTNAANAGKGVQKHVIDAMKTNLSNVPKLAKQVFAAAPRNAYLGMLRINLFRLASQIWTKAARDKNSSNWNKIAQKWESLGGNRNSLYKAVEAGKNHYNRHHPNQKISGIRQLDSLYGSIGYLDSEYDGYSQSIGEPMTIAAMIATATPIIIAMAVILKTLGIAQQKDDVTYDPNATIDPDSPIDPNLQAAIDVANAANDALNNSYPNTTGYEGYYGDQQYPQYYDQPYDNSPTLYNSPDVAIDPATGLPYKQTGMFDDATSWIKNFYYENKKPILLIGGTIVAIKVAPYIFNKKKTRRR